MKNIIKMFTVVLLFMVSFIYVNVKADTFDTKSTKYNDCESLNLGSYGAPNKNEICRFYSVNYNASTNTETPANAVFCLEPAKEIVWGTYESVGGKNYDNRYICGFSSLINSVDTLSSITGTEISNLNNGSTIYLESLDYFTFSTYKDYQIKIWDSLINSTGLSNCEITSKKTTYPKGYITTNVNSVELKKSGDNYVGSFTVSSDSLVNGFTYTSDSSDVVLSKSENTINVSVPASKITSLKNYKITLKGTYNDYKEVTARPFMQVYACKVGVGNCDSADSHQKLGRIGFDIGNTTKTADVSTVVEVTVKPTGLTLKKVDETRNLLDGAVVKVTKDGVDYQIVTLTNGTYSFGSNLEYGKYCVTEVTAPLGYVKTNVSSCVTLSQTNTLGEITITNKKTSISFLKIDSSTKKPLQGATLQILDANNNVILDENSQPKYKWVSTTENHVIDGLPVGVYYLQEVSAPEGYSLNSDLIKFEVKSDGTVVSDEQLDKETAVVIMENKKTRTEFSKQDATTGKELPGATLQILDKDKKEIKDANGKVLYKWVSTDKPYIIEGLPVGIYYLQETIQPKGYELSKELVKFEVKSDGTVTKVVMKNTPIIEVPDTALSKSVIYGIIGGILALLGIGLIIYVVIRKKNSKI